MAASGDEGFFEPLYRWLWRLRRQPALLRSRSAKKIVMPSVGRLQSSRLVVRVSSMILLATCAVLVHTFWPCTT